MRSPSDPRPDHRHVVIVVQNLPVPFDRRVWRQSLALVRAGYHVTVICPRGPGQAARERLEGVDIRRYPPVPDRAGKAWYVAESLWAWSCTAVLLANIHRTRRIDVLQACNPPDTYASLALALRPAGVRFVFDQHDLSPELYAARFGRRDDIPYLLLRLFERMTYRTADHVVVTNESHHDIARERGRVPADRITVVRNGPDPARLYTVDPDPSLRRGRRHLCCYLGMMGVQDGADTVLLAMSELVHGLGRDDVHVALLGDGQELPRMRALAGQLGVDERVTFTGLADDDTIRRYLSTADLGLSPEPPDPLNDVSSLVKVSEYLAFGLPVVAFDLRETRRTAGRAGVYVRPASPAAYAACISSLLDDPRRRRRMSRTGSARVRDALAWSHQRDDYLRVVDRVVGAGARRRATSP